MKQPILLLSELNKNKAIFQVCLDVHGNYLSINTSYHNFVAHSNKTDSTFIFPDLIDGDIPSFRAVLNQCIHEPGEAFTITLCHKSEPEKAVKWEVTGIEYGEAQLVHCRGEIQRQDQPNTKFKEPNLTNLFNNILNSSVDLLCAIDRDGKFLAVNEASSNILGYEPHEMVGRKYDQFIFAEDIEKTLAIRPTLHKDEALHHFENRYVKKDGTLVTMDWSVKWDSANQTSYCIMRDATRRTEFETAIKASEEKYKFLFHKNPQPQWIYDIESLEFLEVNEAAIEHYGYSRKEFFSMTIKDIRPIEEIERLLRQSVAANFSTEKTFWKHKKKNGDIIEVEITANVIDFEGHKAKLILSNDITELLKVQHELQNSNERYIYASKAAFDAIWDWNIKNNDLLWSESYHSLFGYELEHNKEQLIEWLNKIHPSDRERVEKSFLLSIKNNEDSWKEGYRFKRADDTYANVIDRGIIIKDKNKKPYRVIGAMHDFTDEYMSQISLKELNNSLEKRAAELASSNKELERFAYVTSHDLQEPLRMVSSFLQLLQKRYKQQLDDKANEYIHFAVDGAERMKVLILDLLRYSRVNTMKEELELVDLNEVCNDTLFTYKSVIEETDATIKVEKLPTVKGTKTQLIQLFQNLVGNALKYKSDRHPEIKIEVVDKDKYWEFSVKDNGIGIDPRFYDKIFVIFQRLHHKDEYSGTGIGLAICKKIVERHGGRIWAESGNGNGSTFYFTLKKNL